MIKQSFYFLKNLVNYASISCILFILSSCQNTSNSFDDKLVFRYNEHKNIGSLDPAFSKDIADIWGTNQLFNGLVQMDDQMNVLPCIAKSWSISEDALTYSFSLRSDVKFHKHEVFGADSTRTVMASDFEYSLNSWVLLKSNLL